jgi:hypothetical protein
VPCRPSPLEFQLHDVTGPPVLEKLGRRCGGGVRLADDDDDDGVMEAELGVHGIVVDVDTFAQVVEAQADGEVVGRGSSGDGEVPERYGVHDGAYLVRLEDGPVHEDHEASGEDEHVAAAVARLLSVAAGARHGE